MVKVIYLFLLFMGLSVLVQAQSQKKNQTSKGDSYNYRTEYNSKPSKKEIRKAKKAYKGSYARQFDVKIKEYEDLFSNPYCAAARGYIDAVLVPSETRPRLIDALEIMCAKREIRPPKKHGNIPI